MMTSHLSRQTTRHPHAVQSRAVVLGGSLAGLLTARVLADHYAEVVVVDRDDLAGELDAPRRGVPQARHTHGLLVGGAEAIERIVPGFTAGVLAGGGMQADILARSRWLMGGHLLSNDAPGLVGLLASRTLIEAQVRRLVAATPGVLLAGRHDVAGLLASADHSRVTGARVVPRDPAGVLAAVPSGTTPVTPGTPYDLPADLVVDATGRGSRAGAWLAQLGYAAPTETAVEAGVSYVTRLFEARPGVLDHLDADVIGTTPPSLRGGVALRQEGGRWTVTLAGCFGEQPPTDLDGFLAYTRTLPTQGLAEIVARCAPVGDAQTFRYPVSRWRHWEKLARRPERLVVIGDAVCSFNPVYGQGMSSTALQVEALREQLARGTDRIAGRSSAAFAKVVATPWALATGQDRRFPGMARKPLPERLLDRYVDRLLAVATHDPQVTMAFGRVLNLLATPPSLLAPAVAWRVLRPGARRPARRTGVSTQTVTAAA